LPLHDSGFTVHIDIESYTDGAIEITHFETGQRFQSQDEAIDAGMKLGQRQIDVGYEIGDPVINDPLTGGEPVGTLG